MDVVGDEVVKEHLTRNIQLFGMESMERLAGACVLVVGAGGVGSHAAAMLCRSGVGRIIVVDFDMVSLSSLNRHAVATRADVGKPKTTVLRDHLKRIFPECDVVPLNMMYTSDCEEEIFRGGVTVPHGVSGDDMAASRLLYPSMEPRIDFVIDAIDNIGTKVDLLAACRRRGIRVLSCGGAGAKVDPTRLTVVDMSEAILDPLCKSVRFHLRRRHGIESGIDVLMSTEKPVSQLIKAGPAGGGETAAAGASHDTASTDGPSQHEYQIIPNFRVGIVPVLGSTPAVFGMAAASWVITRLSGNQAKTYLPRPMYHIQSKQLEAVFNRLLSKEDDLSGGSAIQVDMPEVVWLTRELWRCKSAWQQYRASREEDGGGGGGVKSKDKGLYREAGNLTLVRWDLSLPARPNNLVLMTLEEAEEHTIDFNLHAVPDEPSSARLDHLRSTNPDFVAFVETVLRRASGEFGIQSDVDM